MSEVLCDNCQVGVVTARTLHNYHTKLKGKDVTIAVAYVRQCAKCSAVYIPAKELKRWLALQEEKQQIPFSRPDDIRTLRELLGLSVGEFALLIGSTRQSVYSWERGSDIVGPIRPIAVLLSAMRFSMEHGSIDLLKYMQSLHPQASSFTCRSILRPVERRTLPMERYQIALNLSPKSTSRKLPGLRAL